MAPIAAPVRPLAERGPFERIVVLTGAGISVAAGLPTYRGPGGLWERDPRLAAALVAGADPSLVWSVLGPLRPTVAAARPTRAHEALARFEARQRAAGRSLTVITQNVDALHARAGTTSVIELHGRLTRTRCSNPRCDLPPFDDASAPTKAPPCPRCGAPLRLDVVLFEEPLGAAEEVAAKRALRDCDLFVAIGTSGTVWPAASFVRSAAYEGAHTIFANLTPPDPPNPAFREVVLGAAEDIVPALFA